MMHRTRVGWPLLAVTGWLLLATPQAFAKDGDQASPTWSHHGEIVPVTVPTSRPCADRPGRPILYSTSPEFLQHFGLNSILEMPPLANPEEEEENHDEMLKG